MYQGTIQKNDEIKKLMEQIDDLENRLEVTDNLFRNQQDEIRDLKIGVNKIDQLKKDFIELEKETYRLHETIEHQKMIIEGRQSLNFESIDSTTG